MGFTKLQRQRKRAIEILFEKGDKDVPMYIDYHLDEYCRQVLNLPERPENRFPYEGWMMVEPWEEQPSNSISQTGIDLIKKWEGLRLKAYQCSANVWTIGYGHTKGVRPGDRVTIAQAEVLLKKDLVRFERGVSNAVDVPLNRNQFDALVSLSFNIGVNAFTGSTLVKLLNQRKYTEASNQFPRWNRAGGRVVKGLSNRRAEEKQLFLS